MIHWFWAGISESSEVIERLPGLPDAHDADSCLTHLYIHRMYTMFCKSSCIHQNILLDAKYFMIGRIKILWSGKSSLCPDWPERTWDGSRSWHASAASNCPGVTNPVWWKKVETASISTHKLPQALYVLLIRFPSLIWIWLESWLGQSWYVESEWILRQFTLPVAAAEGSFCLLRPAPAVCVRKKSNEWRAGSRARGCLVPDVIGIDSNWSH